MSAHTLDYRGTVVPEEDPVWEQVRAQLISLAEQYPVGLRVVHACGRQGTVTLDQAEHVPGLFNGKPAAVCLTGEWREPMVFAHWENEAELTWGVWVPVASIRRGTAPVANRPGNKSRIGGR
ncbi:hypothetical protein [Streptomyces roseochromogenus]|uniref:Uncharacterized protein n=1 Tax=Streptomyces roseochromogenus subsp. oscitans DS 12.976 TaxID=1352936 RepID=V6JXD9_STRRC|nr:hypothetical protein [Streptomyces roseochromogenus]EST24492.1 hypothetical protein M878_30465 [Streptomyces roseochromogenus subsp. oscitans DS 12.976]